MLVVHVPPASVFSILNTLLSQWEFSRGKFRLLSPQESLVRQSRATLPSLNLFLRLGGISAEYFRDKVFFPVAVHVFHGCTLVARGSSVFRLIQRTRH